MLKNKILFPLIAVAALLSFGNVYAQTAATSAPTATQKKILIIVENRAGANLNDKISVLEDLVSSRVAGNGFSVVSRDVAVNALKTYPTLGVSATTKSAATDRLTSAPDHLTVKAETEQTDSAHIAATPDTTQLDQALSDNTTALRLAQNLNVDYILIPSITSYGTEKKSYSGNGIQTLNVTHRLRVSYKIVETGAGEGGEGGAVRGGAFVSESTTRETADLQVDSTDTLNSLLDDAADQLATAITANAGTMHTAVTQAGLVNFSVACSMTDPRQQPILVSAMGISADNKIVNGAPTPMQAMDVTVELDGVALGSAPGDFKGHPGLHKIRLTREGFDDWARTINIYDGQKLHVALQMSAAGYQKWKDTTDFLATLDANRKLTDAEVKQIEGVAEFYKNSHYRIDASNAPNVNIYKSLY